MRVIKNGVYTVQRGDSLWAIAKDFCGSGARWYSIYQANRSRIHIARLIYSGMKLVIPCATR